VEASELTVTSPRIPMQATVTCLSSGKKNRSLLHFVFFLNQQYRLLAVAIINDARRSSLLGTNYPRGPATWGERIGWDYVLAVMKALHEFFGDDRPAPLLRKKATRSA
jgi:hypothetical protein